MLLHLVTGNQPCTQKQSKSPLTIIVCEVKYSIETGVGRTNFPVEGPACDEDTVRKRDEPVKSGSAHNGLQESDPGLLQPKEVAPSAGSCKLYACRFAH